MTANKRIQIESTETETLVDERELIEEGLTIREAPAKRAPPEHKFKYEPAQVDSLLAQAGYEPADIPRGQRKTALFVAWAWARGLSDVDDVARASGRTVVAVRRAAGSLRFARTPVNVEGKEVKS